MTSRVQFLSTGTLPSVFYDHRFLVDWTDIKYIAFTPDALPKDYKSFDPVLMPLLPYFPSGNWNEGLITRDPVTKQLVFAHCNRVHLPEIQNIWHPKKFDLFEFTILRCLAENVYVATHSAFPGPVLVKFADFPQRMPDLEAETTAYEWIEGKHIGPRFLGHLTEGERFVGFVTKFINGRPPESHDDTDAVLYTLAKLHALGIRHGDLHYGNVLIRSGGKAVIIDFETAKRKPPKKLRDERDGVAASWPGNGN
ncbi:Fc.00g074980.m01.CDS01 [Cosmosporella sp. VM-42]